ncbi:MAG: porin family protein [Prevotellaceae bacterium]|jgi:outer membrane protein|nr:porin family protein [Prevotellaceae bacterium]
MKKLLLTAALAVATMIGANAQIYVGGSLGFDSYNEESGSALKNQFTISPEIGFYLSEKFDVGLDFSFSTEKYHNDAKGNSWAIAPYARYSFLQFGKFEVIGKAQIYFEGDKQEDPAGNELKGTGFGLNVTPILAYNLTENWVLFTQLNCFALGFSSYTPDGGDAGTHFGLGLDANDLYNTNNLQVGFVYKF